MTRTRIAATFCAFALLSLAPAAPWALGPARAYGTEKCKFCVTINLIVIGGKYCYEGPCSSREAPEMPHWIP